MLVARDEGGESVHHDALGALEEVFPRHFCRCCMIIMVLLSYSNSEAGNLSIIASVEKEPPVI